MLLMKVVSRFFCSSFCGSSERLRVINVVDSDDGLSELMMVLVDPGSAAKARPAVIASTAPAVIAFVAKNLTELVMVVILAVPSLLAIGWPENRTGSNTRM